MKLIEPERGRVRLPVLFRFDLLLLVKSGKGSIVQQGLWSIRRLCPFTFASAQRKRFQITWCGVCKVAQRSMRDLRRFQIPNCSGNLEYGCNQMQNFASRMSKIRIPVLPSQNLGRRPVFQFPANSVWSAGSSFFGSSPMRRFVP